MEGQAPVLQGVKSIALHRGKFYLKDLASRFRSQLITMISDDFVIVTWTDSTKQSGHAVSIINADQYRSMPDQIFGIDTNADQ